MKTIIKQFTPYIYVSFLCMVISNVSYAGFFDDLKKQVEKSVKETADDIKGNIDKSVNDTSNDINKNIDKTIKSAPDNVIRNVKGSENKNGQAIEKDNPQKNEIAQEIVPADNIKKEDDQIAAQRDDEDAKWAAQVAEEKARRAKKQLGQAEHMIYQEDVDLALQENTQAIERARKKDAAERVPGHDHRTQDWHIAHKGVDQFKKMLNTYEVDGLSLGMKISVLEKSLIRQGYKRLSRKIIHSGPQYIYRRKTGKNASIVEIRAAEFNDIPNTIIINLHNPDGVKMIAEEKIRLLNTFSGTCFSKRKGYPINCFKYTDTNKLSIEVSSPKQSELKYRISNVPSRDAK